MKPKPGYKTTEFWMCLAANIVGGAIASGAIPDESGLARILGVAAMALTTLGYTVGRSWVKGV